MTDSCFLCQKKTTGDFVFNFLAVNFGTFWGVIFGAIFDPFFDLILDLIIKTFSILQKVLSAVREHAAVFRMLVSPSGALDQKHENDPESAFCGDTDLHTKAKVMVLEQNGAPGPKTVIFH